MADEKVHLTFAQIAWFITILSAIFWTWGDLRVQIAKMESRAAGLEQRVTAIELRNMERGFTRDDAEALRDDILKQVRVRR